MCPDCNNVTRNYTWEACVQLRQKVHSLYFQQIFSIG